MNIPDMSGHDLQCKLREGGVTSPIIIVTGEADVVTASLALKEGAVDIIAKPIDPPALLQIVRDAILARKAA
jgi:FixJ family two-component response regulator